MRSGDLKIGKRNRDIAPANPISPERRLPTERRIASHLTPLPSVPIRENSRKFAGREAQKDMPEEIKPFETSLDELEGIVRKLESGDLSLDESLKLFESGVRLARECQERLDQAERRIEVLIRESADGNPALRDFEPEEPTF